MLGRRRRRTADRSPVYYQDVASSLPRYGANGRELVQQASPMPTAAMAAAMQMHNAVQNVSAHNPGQSVSARFAYDVNGRTRMSVVVSEGWAPAAPGHWRRQTTVY